MFVVDVNGSASCSSSILLFKVDRNGRNGRQRMPTIVFLECRIEYRSCGGYGGGGGIPQAIESVINTVDFSGGGGVEWNENANTSFLIIFRSPSKNNNNS